MRAWLLLLVLLPSAALAQGAVTGHAVNAANADAKLPGPAIVCAVFLPADSHPFREITAATWQDAMTAIAEKREITTPFGGLDSGVKPSGSATAPVEGSGAFRLEDLPLETRIGLAVRVEGLWWPLREEIWLTREKPSDTVRLLYCLTGAESPTLELHELSLDVNARPSLRFGAIKIQETLRLQNTDSARATLVEIALDLAMVPGIAAHGLPSLYGNQLFFMQGWNLGEPLSAPKTDRANQSWRLGTPDAMHGGQPEFGSGPQGDPENWHPLQGDRVMAMCGAGDTRFRLNRSPDGRSATLVFRRVVPPAIGGKPGLLEIRLLHFGGAFTSDPGQATRLARTFPLALRKGTATARAGVSLHALVADDHLRFYSEPTVESRTSTFATAREPALEAGKQVELVVGFDQAMQKMLADMEAKATGAAPGEGDDTGSKAEIKIGVVFQVFALLFGLAFVVALIASIRRPAEKQRENLNRLPGTRDELMRALVDLEADYKRGAIPASAFLEHKQRLVNRLVETDSGGG